MTCGKTRVRSEQAKELNLPNKVLLPCADNNYYPNIHSLIVILTTLPITSCENERSISMLQLVKTALCSSWTGARLNVLKYH